jgi:4-hydroxy-tetrahydrodipicolinate reductase
MSVGVNVMLDLVARASKSLGPDYDVEVFELHHKLKVDAPSGTALKLGEVAAAARGAKLADAGVFARHGNTGERKSGTIGFSVARGGDIVGDHTVYFAGPGERVEITHRAASRATYAQGAMRAAKFLAGKPPGLYSMADVLGLG